MRIHSSSLAAIPLSTRRAQADPVARAHEVVLPEDLIANKPRENNQPATELKTQSSLDIEKLLEKEKPIKSKDLVASGLENKPFNKRIQHAINAYASQENLFVQNQRPDLIVGVDFYA